MDRIANPWFQLNERYRDYGLKDQENINITFIIIR